MEPVTHPRPRVGLGLALAVSLLFNTCGAIGLVARPDPKPKIIRDSGPTTTTTACDAACRGWTPDRSNALFLALRKQYGDDKTALCVTAQLVRHRADEILGATEYQQAQVGADAVAQCSTFANGTTVYPAAPALAAVKP